MPKETGCLGFLDGDIDTADPGTVHSEQMPSNRHQNRQRRCTYLGPEVFFVRLSLGDRLAACS